MTLWQSEPLARGEDILQMKFGSHTLYKAQALDKVGKLAFRQPQYTPFFNFLLRVTGRFFPEHAPRSLTREPESNGARPTA